MGKAELLSCACTQVGCADCKTLVSQPVRHQTCEQVTDAQQKCFSPLDGQKSVAWEVGDDNIKGIRYFAVVVLGIGQKGNDLFICQKELGQPYRSIMGMGFSPSPARG
jgi:hypothetical protein